MHVHFDRTLRGTRRSKPGTMGRLRDLRRDPPASDETAPAPPTDAEVDADPLPQVGPAAGPGDEERMRASGGPNDQATYACMCGYVFEASVSTSVTCPHCGCGQAW